MRGMLRALTRPLRGSALLRWAALLGPATTPFHVESASVKRRRRAVVLATGVVGAVVLGLTLQAPPGSDRFYWLGLALATTWIVGSVASGPLHLGRQSGRRHVAVPAVLGAIAFAGFAVAAVVVRRVPALDDLVSDVISRADVGSRTLVVAVALVNGVAEELFFRGALYSAFGRSRPALWSTLAYVAVTAASGNAMLTLAAAAMGTLFALDRRATRGILAPTVTHVVWSTLMIFFLPR
jgi:membrane protease YdiL (CAAX protease family)